MTTKSFLFFLNVDAVPKNLTSGEYAYVNPFKLKKNRLIHFNSDVFAVVPAIVASYVAVFMPLKRSAATPTFKLTSTRSKLH